MMLPSPIPLFSEVVSTVVVPRLVVELLSRLRLPLADEKALQERIAEAFTLAGFVFEREVRLSPGDIIDFMVGDCGVEVKIKGRRREIFKQCVRYCSHERVHALVLATNIPMGLPESINGKPVAICDLGRAWL